VNRGELAKKDRALEEANKTLRRVLDAINENDRTIPVTGRLRLNLVSSHILTRDALKIGKEA
jgi:RecB family endonuclease NucS